ncbi:MAG: ATP synthase subunit I [Xenococcaceae cyanobacterium MO_188.B19]|nr:ATP synthase subunit I [Xenococcaceae cyanobacterium MO_188.B19]
MSQSPSALSNQSPETTEKQQEKLTQESSPSNEQGNSMTEYYELQRTLYIYTLTLMGLIFVPVWYFYSLNTALNYLLGALVSLVYLRFLAKDVERLGQQEQRIGGKGLGIFAILIIVASKWQQLSILPVFLGFLTYKGGIIFYMLQSVFSASGELDSEITNTNVSEESSPK